MVTSATCPACGTTFAPPPGYAGGPLACPKPGCGNSFEASPLSVGAVGAAAAAAQAAARPAVRPPGARPELLDRLPPSAWVSPPTVAGGAVAILFYGMVLFAVVKAQRNRPEPEPPARAALAYAPLPSHAPTPPSAPDTKAEGKSQPAKPGSRPEKAESKPDSKAARPPGDESKNQAAPPKTAIARVSPSPAPAPPPPPPPKDETWGPLSGARGDWSYRSDPKRLTVNIPGTLHLLSPEAGVRNAPRLTTEVQGDFKALVTVSGKIMPGTDPLPGLPFTFQGAGLLVWQDENNYLRFERTSIFSAEHKRLHQVLLTLCRDGRTVVEEPKNARDADLTLRLERKGSEIRCSYNPDGRTWVEVKRQMVTFPGGVRVGVSAGNASPKPLSLRLENFELSGPGVAEGKGT